MNGPESMSTGELIRLLRGVFAPREEDRSLALMIDLPDERRLDRPAWADRRSLAADWMRRLAGARGELGLETVELVAYRNAGRNNADLPERAWCLCADEPPARADDLDPAAATPMAEIFDRQRLIVSLAELSATAPLKLAARRHGFRAASMPGFSREMLPALRLDYEDVHRRCAALTERLDRAERCRIRTEAAGAAHELTLDLRHRRSTASGGLVRQPGTAGNLPSGESYIVPYEGEIAGDPSRSAGELPLELDGELLVYAIERNRVVGVTGDGRVAGRERREIADEPAYANVAELGLGVLADFGVRPVGEILLDEKLGLHVAFGRSDHFGGRVGTEDFSSPDRVVHIDRIYLPEIQPSVRVAAVDLGAGDRWEPLMRNGRYV